MPWRVALSVFVLCLQLTSFCLHSKMDFQFPFVLRPPESTQIKLKWETVVFCFCFFYAPTLVFFIWFEKTVTVNITAIMIITFLSFHFFRAGASGSATKNRTKSGSNKIWCIGLILPFSIWSALGYRSDTIKLVKIHPLCF